MNFTEQKAKLSTEYSKVINEWLSKDELQTVNQRNELPDYANACATHDFCDANQAILDVFSNAFGREFEFGNENDEMVISAAWELSKKNKFAI